MITLKNYLTMISQFFGLISEIIRVNAYAMSSNEAWSHRDEVPLGACGFEDVVGIDAEGCEDFGEQRSALQGAW